MTAKPDQTVGRCFPRMGRVTALVAMVAFTIAPALQADVPDRSTVQRSGIDGYYKVVSTNDPFFGSDSKREWFMDFGDGVRVGRTTGSVAISMRQNPSVRVRMFVWQLDPATKTLTVGSQTGENSRQAVALAKWDVTSTPTGLVLSRNGYQVALRRASAAE